ncbi:LysR family transcriptional regulator [Ideonella azotifigens]|uniref:LysR family transcriptional regulator n=1 Tax=Ideonella azotifigens TaxID=513160 RepID=A0ABN1JTA1_9BURK|nr:LysR family transcriptional regulator [Ideonella azotifigens]MCD2340947.1 LysR family transcriptional regulator [Ideonella azotifigens]
MRPSAIGDAQQLAAMVVFARVVAAGSFSAAARELGLTKSAVSKQVQRLELELGAKLLNRSTRKLSLTEPGQIVHAHAEQIVHLSNATRNELAQLSERPSGLLRMTASLAYGKHVLAPLLPDFFAQCPEVRVALTLVDRHVDLIEEGFDLAIRLTDTPPEPLAGRRLHACEFVLCASPKFAGLADVQHARDLAQQACLGFSAGVSAKLTPWRLTDPDGKAVTVAVQGPAVVNSSDVVRELTLRGLGIGLLPRFTVEPDLAQGQLVQVLPQWQAAGAFGPAWALWSPQRQMLPKQRAMIDFLVSRLSAA